MTLEQLKQQRDELLAALIQLKDMPEYDGTPDTSRQRLRAKRAAREAIKNATKGNK
jgi:hypothetical protein